MPVLDAYCSVALVEIAQQLVVQQAVGRGRVAAVRARAAVETGEAAAGLAARSIAFAAMSHRRQFRFGADVHRALGDHHVRPEVAVGARAPHLAGQVEEAVQPALVLPAGQRGVRERGVRQPATCETRSRVAEDRLRPV